MVYRLFTDNAQAFKQIYPDYTINDNITVTFNYSDIFGNIITISSDDDICDFICELICDFFTEYYFQDIIFNKIYDEYSIFDIKKAVEILILFSDSLKSSCFYTDIKNVLLKNCCFHFEYYMIFKKNFVVSLINSIIDKICMQLDEKMFIASDKHSLINKIYNSEVSENFDFQKDK